METWLNPYVVPYLLVRASYSYPLKPGSPDAIELAGLRRLFLLHACIRAINTIWVSVS